MEKIVQLRQHEYEELFNKARMNEEEIEKRAQLLYEQKGTYGIELVIDCRDDHNYKSNILFRADSYIKDWESFPISEEDKRKIVKTVNERTLRMMTRKFGKQITSISYYDKMEKEANKLRARALILTVCGWLLATTLIIIDLLK
ncbi:hypothetical protein [Porphyromonas levii]|uniref:hypothetical protein n=1 Tax=Porphyromonas levii TaxID=28114 RepID=UPI001B8ABDE9|nr:hypothetical protein [Porphyromonas levii]MBR8712307.1 hypothetical protein [Porphyromonas levii]MBR8714226.1 hypothetical protein [Porphyromonas levii]MBR8726768.1 hypothetical protein [Porphyromonas levii]MBR8735073.1 hypothetical protein [Porphyromonas levii]MBR8777176.1 hypothetical protein [Porphyromonas levii]